MANRVRLSRDEGRRTSERFSSGERRREMRNRKASPIEENDGSPRRFAARFSSSSVSRFLFRLVYAPNLRDFVTDVLMRRPPPYPPWSPAGANLSLAAHHRLGNLSRRRSSVLVLVPVRGETAVGHDLLPDVALFPVVHLLHRRHDASLATASFAARLRSRVDIASTYSSSSSTRSRGASSSYMPFASAAAAAACLRLTPLSYLLRRS